MLYTFRELIKAGYGYSYACGWLFRAVIGRPRR